MYCQLVSPKCIFGKILCSANIAIGNCKVKISLHTMHILSCIASFQIYKNYAPKAHRWTVVSLRFCSRLKGENALILRLISFWRFVFKGCILRFLGDFQPSFLAQTSRSHRKFKLKISAISINRFACNVQFYSSECVFLGYQGLDADI